MPVNRWTRVLQLTAFLLFIIAVTLWVRLAIPPEMPYFTNALDRPLLLDLATSRDIKGSLISYINKPLAFRAPHQHHTFQSRLC